MVTLMEVKFALDNWGPGLYWHAWHAGYKMFWVKNPQRRLQTIMDCKPKIEIPERLRLFKPVQATEEILPYVVNYVMYQDIHNWYAREPEIENFLDRLHAVECRDCPWSETGGELILPRRKDGISI